MIASEKLIEAFSEVLGRPRISSRYGITSIDVQDLATEIRTEGRLYPDPARPPRYVPDDPDDDYVVALALAARADALVTRDRHIHSARIVGLRVMYPGKFRKLLSESNPP